ncbi:TIGR02302 family protein [Undibacter mobilis]|uniref:TIGR02302 family protein n=2 Tax=Undibacter mobilis TaxID=2292256 RepID=A0A371BDH8_9BRAD|nr:TIGR02302 family protein [Undibacter mobilis]RDV05656.1 TIGR02302 family protein [Undibacter mobilis]
MLARAVQRARGSLLWERLWPALAALATALGLFLAMSWAGLWLALPPLGRVIGLVVFVAVFVVAAIPILRLRVPSDREGLRRLDAGSGAMHRPATSIADEISANRNDPVAQALWQAHIERALLAANKLKAGWPQPKLSLRDPMALRALVVLLVAATFISAGSERWKRVTAAFDWKGVVAPANFRIDAWVTPPNYTGRPPVMLPGVRPGETTTVDLSGAPISVPAGSQLVVRSTGKVSFDIERAGGIEDVPLDPKTALPAGTEERRFVIKTDGKVTLRGAASTDPVWSFAAIPDRAPTVELIKDPERQARGALRLDYKMEDDYGIVEGKAIFALKQDKSATAGKSVADSKRRPLFDAPQFPLTLPQARTRSGAAQTTQDLTENPWAGSTVTVTLTVRDEGGNVGESQPRELTLPQRIFVKPLARALVEQRRILALDANEKPLVLTALDALAIAPERFTPEAGVYLGLRSIFFDLRNAKTDDSLRDVVARLWQMALQIEDGNVSQAEQALRQAQDALREALERGASDEELKKLMDNLRAAMDKFLQALAEEMRKNPQAQQRPLDRNTQMLSQRDLKSMLDRMEQMARQGNRDAAKQLLDQLQQMMENLQMARPGADQDQGDQDMNSALDELSDMIRKQQQLRDKTFKEGQDQRRQQRGQRGQQGNQQMGDLKQDQQALKDRLNKLLEQLRQRGMGQQQGEKGQGQKGEGQQGEGQEQGDQDGMGQLGDAGEAMGEAEGSLGDGNADGAVDSQGRALEAMRKGAQGLAQQMQQGQGQAGPGPNGQPGRGRQRAEQNTDPLGRPLRGRDYGDDTTVKVPGEIDAQRARRILEELRKRFGEGFRPQLELDYIERLLKDF